MFSRFLATTTRTIARMAESAPSPTGGASASRSFSGTAAARTTTIYVGNLSWSTDDSVLAQNFEQFGSIEKATVVMRDGRSAGFGFVDFNDDQAAKTAIEEMNNAELDGRTITVQERVQRSGGFGGGRGRGGFSRGGRGGFSREGGSYGGREGGSYGGREGGYSRDNGYSRGGDRGDSYRGGGRGGGWGRDSGRDNGYSGGNGSREEPY